MTFQDGMTLVMFGIGIFLICKGTRGFAAAFQGNLRNRLTRAAVSALLIAMGALSLYFTFSRAISLN